VPVFREWPREREHHQDIPVSTKGTNLVKDRWPNWGILEWIHSKGAFKRRYAKNNDEEAGWKFSGALEVSVAKSRTKIEEEYDHYSESSHCSRSTEARNEFVASAVKCDGWASLRVPSGAQ